MNDSEIIAVVDGCLSAVLALAVCYWGMALVRFVLRERRRFFAPSGSPAAPDISLPCESCGVAAFVPCDADCPNVVGCGICHRTDVRVTNSLTVPGSWICEECRHG